MNKENNIKANGLIIAIGIIIIVGLIAWKENYYDPNHIVINTISPAISSIENKIMVAGSVFPSKEIEVKSPISGILDELFVKIGQSVHAGDRIAKIKVVPSPTQIEAAKTNVNYKRIDFESKENEYKRNQPLYYKNVISSVEFETYKRDCNLAKEQYQSAQNELKLLLDGFVNSTDISNIIKAPIDGVINELPLEQGSSVIERNNFNPGSTIASIAQMDYMIFKGKVNEVDLSKLNIRSKITIMLNAYNNSKITTEIEKIYPKGVQEQGSMKYLVEAKFNAVKFKRPIRAGYTAIAEIVLESKKHVLTIDEKYITFRNDSAFVELIKGDKIEKKFVRIGISDGIKTEIEQGITKKDRIKIIE